MGNLEKLRLVRLKLHRQEWLGLFLKEWPTQIPSVRLLRDAAVTLTQGWKGSDR